MAEFVGTPADQHRRFAVVASRFNQAIVERLMDGALDALVRHGVSLDDVDTVWVPGAWELPIAARRLLASERYEGIVAVGAVIRGDTPHFDYVAGAGAGERRVRHADRFWAPHVRQSGTGRGARRRRARKQGLGRRAGRAGDGRPVRSVGCLSLIHISEPTRLLS